MKRINRTLLIILTLSLFFDPEYSPYIGQTLAEQIANNDLLSKSETISWCTEQGLNRILKGQYFPRSLASSIGYYQIGTELTPTGRYANRIVLGILAASKIRRYLKCSGVKVRNQTYTLHAEADLESMIGEVYVRLTEGTQGRGKNKDIVRFFDRPGSAMECGLDYGVRSAMVGADRSEFNKGSGRADTYADRWYGFNTGWVRVQLRDANDGLTEHGRAVRKQEQQFNLTGTEQYVVGRRTDKDTGYEQIEGKDIEQAPNVGQQYSEHLSLINSLQDRLTNPERMVLWGKLRGWTYEQMASEYKMSERDIRKALVRIEDELGYER